MHHTSTRGLSCRFTHLHVASSFSLRYGTMPPEQLVERAVELGYDRLALTDRDGLYGVVKFVSAAVRAGVEPIVGVDLALEMQPSISARSPLKGGLRVNDRGPRVVVLARGNAGGVSPGVGWAALCGLVSEAHCRGKFFGRGHLKGDGSRYEREGVHTSRQRIAAAAYRQPGETPALTVLVGPASDVGLALIAGQYEKARRLLIAWREALGQALVVEVVNHGGEPRSIASKWHAVTMWRLARACGVPAVLSGWVRHATPGDAITADVLDASRRMVALNINHLDRQTTLGYLRSEREMYVVAEELASSAEGLNALELIQATNALAEACVQDPRRDIGLGAIHLPEPDVLGLGDVSPHEALTERCRSQIGARYGDLGAGEVRRVTERLDNELQVICGLGYSVYFLTVALVCDLIREAGVRAAARGSGAGSLVNYLLGISGVDPMRYGLLMERFCTPLRASLPDIDIDVESAERTRMYRLIMERFGLERVACVSMMETYRVRHAIRDAGAALGMPPADVDAIAQAFPHIAARDVRHAVSELPELRARGLGAMQLDRLFDLVERLDGLPRHVALHPCGMILSHTGLHRLTPLEESPQGYMMSQFDKDDVETLGFLKLDVLGIRMQSAVAHAVAEARRVDGISIDLDDRNQVRLDDEKTFSLIQSTKTLGCFQIESPGQRELIGRFSPETFEDLIIDISLFRPGPVKSDMIAPFLEARHGWKQAKYLHESLIPALEETHGVVVFHEQILQIFSITTGATLAQGDELRRGMGSREGQEKIEKWWRGVAQSRGYNETAMDRIWAVLEAFASFGFCKAHAASFALPTYQSAWLKAHHPAAFFAGVLTHDPGMYPKRLIVADARNFNIAISGIDINRSGSEYHVEKNQENYSIRMSFSEVKGIAEGEVTRLIAGQPYDDLIDVWNRGGLSRPVLERLILIGGFDDLYGLSQDAGRHPYTRRDLLLQLEDLARWHGRTSKRGVRSVKPASPQQQPRGAGSTSHTFDGAGGQKGTSGVEGQRDINPSTLGAHDQGTQLVLGLESQIVEPVLTGLPELSLAEKVRAELDILGIDVSGHAIEFYEPLLTELGIVKAEALAGLPGEITAWCAGVKVATQTPPVRSGRRVIFLTVDDGSGPADATFFEDVQGPYADTIFHAWILLIRGVVRRTGPRGVSLRATGAWDLAELWKIRQERGLEAVRALLAASDFSPAHGHEDPQSRRVLVHPTGFTQSPYADIKPAGDVNAGARVKLPGEGGSSRHLWHASPGSSGGWAQ